MWFRFYAEALNDPKVQRLDGETFKGWVNLLCLAKTHDGTLPDTVDIAFGLRKSQAEVETLLQALDDAGLIEQTPNGLSPHNWDSRQYVTDNSTHRVRKYRQRRKDAGLPTLSDYSKFRPDLVARDGECCVYCGAVENLVVDHMIPLALGGDDDLENLALACKECNSGKSGRTPELANLDILTPSAKHALTRYRDARTGVTVTETPPEQSQTQSQSQKQSQTQKGVRGKTATRIPDGWVPTEDDFKKGREKGFSDEEIGELAEEFRDYWSGRSKDATRVNWSGVFRNRLRMVANDRPRTQKSTMLEALYQAGADAQG